MEALRGECGVEDGPVADRQHPQDALEQPGLLARQRLAVRGQAVAESEPVEFDHTRRSGWLASRGGGRPLEASARKEVLDALREELAIERVHEGTNGLQPWGRRRYHLDRRDVGRLEPLPIHVAPRPGLARLRRP